MEPYCEEKRYFFSSIKTSILLQKAATLLTAIQKDDVLHFIRSLRANRFTFRDLARFLDIDSDDRRSLQHYLDELDSQDIIHRVKRGLYSLPASQNLIAGVLNCHRDGYAFLVPDNRTHYREDIFIPARNLEDGMHGDHVLIKVTRKKRPRRYYSRDRRRSGEEEKLEGSIVRVLERKFPNVVGRYYAHPRFPFVVPLDTRISHDIRIPYHASKGSKNGQIVVANITMLPGRNQIPHGRITEILGYPGDRGIDYKIVRHKFGLPMEFSPEALREADGIPDHVLREEHEKREDFRHEIAITIDSETARDYDDAVTLKKLTSGNYLLGVHIADVSYYIREGTALDAEAYARGTAVYFPECAIPMLPRKISSGICSLKPQEDRLVLSALMEVNRQGRIVRKCFTEGLLRSREKMSYSSVAKILANRNPEEMQRYAYLVPLFEHMQELCLILSKKRYRRGAVDFDLPEADIQFDQNGKIINVVPAERNIAHRIIEEFMLLANEAVAEELVAAGGAGIYRVHEKPDPQKVEDFAKFAQALGYRLESRNREYHPKTFQKFIEQLEGRHEGRFVAYLMLRSFMQARYSEKNLGHFALATSVYTHFTSPIRRYPDLVVHRLLKECLRRESSTAWQAKMSERLPEIARHASLRERIADEAEREIERIKKAQFMADKIGEEFKGIVFSVSRQGFLVELMDHFVEGFVPVSSLVHNHYVYHEKTRSFVGKQRQRFELGTKVQVSLGSVDLETGRLIFSLV